MPFIEDFQAEAVVTKDEMPDVLRPYHFHGVRFKRDTEKQYKADCPFCDRPKFSVNIDKGVWRCFSCQTGSDNGGGNIYTFLRKLHELSSARTDVDGDFDALAHNRSLLNVETLHLWGVVKSITTEDWLIPGYGFGKGRTDEVKINNLYRCIRQPDGKIPPMCTPTLNHCLYGVQFLSPKIEDLYLVEGPWDGMVTWELFRMAKPAGDGDWMVTGNIDASLAHYAGVVATPSANVWRPDWNHVVARRNLHIGLHNDHPRKNKQNGSIRPPAGYMGTRRIVEELVHADEPPETVQIIQWGEEGYTKDLPNGYDVRDMLGQSDTARDRVKDLRAFTDRFGAYPADWLQGRSKEAIKAGSVELELLECTSWAQLMPYWEEAMHWNEGLDRALSVMLASVISTEAIGDQLWVKIIGPAACGKSTLCEAISVCKEFVLAKSTMRGFHSGFKSDKDGDEDYSLLKLVKNRTLVTKDGDTLLQSPNLGQILSEARDVYDRVSRTNYRHGLNRDYEGINMTWILAGTESLRSIDSSELGERFLDCVIVDQIDIEAEKETGMMVAYRAAKDLTQQVTGELNSRESPAMTLVKQMTGGYVRHIRRNANAMLSAVKDNRWALARCVDLGTFVAYMRARPSRRQAEKASREMSFRLISQMVRAGKCLAAVLNRPTMDKEVMRRVTRTAMNTARGVTLDLVKILAKAGADGKTLGGITTLTNHEDGDELRMLRFLSKIGAVESYKPKSKHGVQHRIKWRLTTEMSRLYQNVYELEGAE